MAQAIDEVYIPRIDLGFPDRRKSARPVTTFTDEDEVEDWELTDPGSVQVATISKR